MDLTEPVTEPGNCHRVSFTVEDVDGATQWLGDVLGATLLPLGANADGIVDATEMGAKLTIQWLGSVPIVLLGSTDPDGMVGRHLTRNGPGVHSLAWEIPDMWRTENLLRANGVAIVGTDIPGRHFFMHPRQTQGLLLEYTDDELPGDPRLGAPFPVGSGVLPVRAVAWVTAVVDDLAATLELLRYAYSAEVIGQASVGADAADEAVDVRIGDLTVRLVVPASDTSFFAGPAPAGAGRYHSMALAVDDFAGIDAHLASAGIGTIARDATTVWTDPRDTMGLPLQFIPATT